MNASLIRSTPEIYLDYIQEKLKTTFAILPNSKIVSNILSAFHGFRSFEAFIRALNSFKGFEAYHIESLEKLRHEMLSNGHINTYKYLTNFYGQSSVAELDHEKFIFLNKALANEVAEFLTELHHQENLTFLDLLGVQYSLTIPVPEFVHKNDHFFHETLDHYSSSYILRACKLKRALEVDQINSNKNCNIDIHYVFADIYGFFDLSSFYTFMRVFKKIIFKNATRLTGKYNSNAQAYLSNKSIKPIKVSTERDWRNICDLVDVSVIQGHLTLARFLFRFYKHPKTSGKSIYSDDDSLNEDECLRVVKQNTHDQSHHSRPILKY